MFLSWKNVGKLKEELHQKRAEHENLKTAMKVYLNITFTLCYSFGRKTSDNQKSTYLSIRCLLSKAKVDALEKEAASLKEEKEKLSGERDELQTSIEAMQVHCGCFGL